MQTRQREMENRSEKKSALRIWLIRNVENPHSDGQTQDSSCFVIFSSNPDSLLNSNIAILSLPLLRLQLYLSLLVRVPKNGLGKNLIATLSGGSGLCHVLP
jgi:hypothetical protein